MAEIWLELAEAASRLDVHPSTLRRWADAGKVPFIRTLSGRRRFSVAGIEKAREEMLVHQGPDSSQDQLESLSLDLAREYTHALERQPAGWIRQLNEDQRLFFRYSGQRLLNLMVQYISRSDPAKGFLKEGVKMAADYGKISANAGLNTVQTAEAFLFFRRSILGTVQATAGLGGTNDPDGYRIFLRATDFFDALLVATLASHTERLADVTHPV